MGILVNFGCFLIILVSYLFKLRSILHIRYFILTNYLEGLDIQNRGPLVICQ
jgi:hypothetical protein